MCWRLLQISWFYAVPQKSFTIITNSFYFWPSNEYLVSSTHYYAVSKITLILSTSRRLISGAASQLQTFRLNFFLISHTWKCTISLLHYPSLFYIPGIITRKLRLLNSSSHSFLNSTPKSTSTSCNIHLRHCHFLAITYKHKLKRQIMLLSTRTDAQCSYTVISLNYTTLPIKLSMSIKNLVLG